MSRDWKSTRNYPMTEVIASREYVLETDDERVPIRVEIGKPTPRPDLLDTWYCPITIQGAGETRLLSADGSDSLQVLLLGLSALGVILQGRASKGKLTFLDGVEGVHIEIL
jgi:hypothetical protein